MITYEDNMLNSNNGNVVLPIGACKVRILVRGDNFTISYELVVQLKL